MKTSGARRLGSVTGVLALALVCAVASAVPLFASSVLGALATSILAWVHVGFGSVFFAALGWKLVLLRRRVGLERARTVWSALLAHLGTALGAYTLLTGILVIPFAAWSDQHLAASFWMVAVVLVHAYDYRERAVELLREVVAPTSLPTGTVGHGVGVSSPALPASRPRKLVIVGAGMAGLAVADEVLRGDSGWQVTMIGEEPQPPYNRVLLSKLLGARCQEEDLELRPRGWFERHDVDLRRGQRAVVIDTERRRVHVRDGVRHEYDALVLATGSRPFVPPIAGVDGSHVFAFRTREDVARIAAAARQSRTAVVIGGGLLGLEAAAGLHARGLGVTVVEAADRLMPQQLDAPGGAALLRGLARFGIASRTGAVVSAIDRRRVRLGSGEELDAELVVVAAGIRPEVALAIGSGIRVTRGVLVDDQLRTSSPDVWAVGECAEHRGNVYGVWEPIARQAKVAASSIVGGQATYRHHASATTLKVAGIGMFAGGELAASASGQTELVWSDGRGEQYRKLVLDNGRVVGVMLVGDTTHAAELGSLLRDGGAARTDLLTPAAISAPCAGATQICLCRGVSRAQILDARAAGAWTVPAVAQATGATTGCGSCVPDVAALIAA